MGIFQHTVVKKSIASQSEKIQAMYNHYASYFLNPEVQENIRNSKEEQFQEGFLRELFVKILGYTLNPEPNYNLITEKKNETNSKKADGAIVINGEVRGVIELKDHKTTDLKQVEAQAFGYKNNHRKTAYVIISNFEKLRFYIENTIDFEEFNLFNLKEKDFAVLWICLAYENIAKDLPKQLKSESTNNEDHITKQLYKDYSTFKRELYADIMANKGIYPLADDDKGAADDKGLKPLAAPLQLFKKTQKLLDRFLFVFFAEDKGLLPPNSMNRIIEQWDRRNDDPLNEYQPLYDRFKLYFKYMDEGHKGKTEDIFAYNGGLFKHDALLNELIINDDVLKSNILKLIVYDFDTEVDVNILGHIFENSLTEMDEITNEITKGHAPLSTSKRKKDGVFYTPRYITTYIVDNTLGKLCADKKTELVLNESEYFSDKKRPKAETKKLADKLTVYRDWLLSLTICDPACGSGAFLNAALDFLMSEHRLVDELTAKLFGSAIVFPDIENAILENNLYGVDINEESVEIAKLALWLRTAKPQRKLNSLNNNIKCGNSLISDPEVAGEKAFDWHKEFPQVFEKGGFDVVIGNPPFVRLEHIRDTS
ncbi:MAG: N-6 DNA methylase [Bacteroidales bacterium]|jgi:type I restriction-modification system DNA methylase subunit|nr:N-6 DNA methylase [Bacteroidales bacterium]